MSEDDLREDRRSTRLALSIPVVISGVDAGGNVFYETVRTLVVNKHGGKVAATHHLAMGSEVCVENRALGVRAKALVVWLGKKEYPGDTHHVGLQLIEAQDVWGIAFPPNDWLSERREDDPPKPGNPADSERQDAAGTEADVPSLAGEEITIRLLQELQRSADAHAREFQDRLKQLTHRLGLELEFDLRERAASVKSHEVGALEQEVRVLGESLRAAREEMGKLEGRIQELKRSMEAPMANVPPTPLQEAQRQLTALTNSVVESMNRAAEAGLGEYRSLLQKENQKNAVELLPAAGKSPPSPPPPPES